MSSDVQARRYQADAVPLLRAAVREHGSVVYVLPTGAGKTHVAAMVARLAAKRDSRVMFLVHRRELVRQAVATLRRAVPGMSIGIEAAGWPSMPWAMLLVGSIPTVVKRPWLADQLASVRLLIIDEAHHCRAASWEKVIGMWPLAKRIGLTATPERLDSKGVGQHFGTMVVGPSIPELVLAGHLAPTRVIRIPLKVQLEGIRRNRTGEIRAADQARIITGKVVAACADSYMTYARGRRAIFFGINRMHSERVCEQLRARGVSAAHLDGDDPHPRRDRVLREFGTGGVSFLGNCDLVSEGLDVPECDCVILGAPTRSITRYLQAAGRGMRPGPDKELLVIDAAGISHDLGLPDEVREWSLEDGLIEKDRGKSKPKPRTCERKECRTVFYGLKCPACGYASAPAFPDEVATELEEARPSPKPKRKRWTRAATNAAIHDARKSEDPEAALWDLAKERGYKKGWVKIILNIWEQRPGNAPRPEA